MKKSSERCPTCGRIKTNRRRGIGAVFIILGLGVVASVNFKSPEIMGILLIIIGEIIFYTANSDKLPQKSLQSKRENRDKRRIISNKRQ